MVNFRVQFFAIVILLSIMLLFKVLYYVIIGHDPPERYVVLLTALVSVNFGAYSMLRRPDWWGEQAVYGQAASRTTGIRTFVIAFNQEPTLTSEQAKELFLDISKPLPLTWVVKSDKATPVDLFNQANAFIEPEFQLIVFDITGRSWATRTTNECLPWLRNSCTLTQPSAAERLV